MSKVHGVILGYTRLIFTINWVGYLYPLLFLCDVSLAQKLVEKMRKLQEKDHTTQVGIIGATVSVVRTRGDALAMIATVKALATSPVARRCNRHPQNIHS